MPHRPRFDPKRPLVAARAFTFMGTAYKAGDPFGPFDDGSVTDRQRERQYETRAVNYGESPAAAPDANPVQMTGPRGGRYEITAPWLDEPEVVRGKVNAEARLAELREAGEPDTYKGVTLTEGDNGWWTITRADLDGELKVHGEDAAREAAAQLRAGEMIDGQPAEWTPQPEGGEGVETEGGETEEETEVVDESQKKPEDGDKPNEPGTNQPNGAEVINDQKRREGSDEEGGGKGGVVGP